MRLHSDSVGYIDKKGKGRNYVPYSASLNKKSRLMQAA
jgi:hypothetical protein